MSTLRSDYIMNLAKMTSFDMKSPLMQWVAKVGIRPNLFHLIDNNFILYCFVSVCAAIHSHWVFVKMLCSQ